MEKLKIMFYQTLMVCTAILFGLGINSLFLHFTRGTSSLILPWYLPLSIIAGGFICTLPTMILLNDNFNKINYFIKIIIHFLCVGMLVSFCGYIFHWYKTSNEFIYIILTYIFIYIFVWYFTIWIKKIEERKINEIIKGFQDEE